MLGNVLMSESFSSSEKRHYFLDFKKTARDSKFIQISRSDQQSDGSYTRSFVIVFEQDFHFLVSAMSSLFHHSAHLGEKGKTVQDLYNEQVIIQERRGIPNWDPAKKPRERLFEHGTDVLTDGELLSVLIGSGTPGEDAVTLSNRMLKSLGGFSGLIGKDISTLSKFNGIGPAKAATIMAVMGIAKRLYLGRE
ncbi:hypothetical protein EZ428_18105 [Pedobacter frigiditerrae]|uniref:UPF0758 domain-containing protein n=1 Tax=Pedobacter frigiditerrae TaxID=2530452 RepID=A0A4R0MP25_9SPHI|nr:UPF0758 domain-containing protein [Pedobacter frigiditerrae]TCC88555.1 hypothetical protein EZ428_18105 [Pedobacter frigiditerrae]